MCIRDSDRTAAWARPHPLRSPRACALPRRARATASRVARYARNASASAGGRARRLSETGEEHRGKCAPNAECGARQRGRQHACEDPRRVIATHDIDATACGLRADRDQACSFTFAYISLRGVARDGGRSPHRDSDSRGAEERSSPPRRVALRRRRHRDVSECVHGRTRLSRDRHVGCANKRSARWNRTQLVAMNLSPPCGRLPRWVWVKPAGAISRVPVLGRILRCWNRNSAVSYTHLDVYKRQARCPGPAGDHGPIVVGGQPAAVQLQGMPSAVRGDAAHPVVRDHELVPARDPQVVIYRRAEIVAEPRHPRAVAVSVRGDPGGTRDVVLDEEQFAGDGKAIGRNDPVVLICLLYTSRCV